MLRHTSEIRIVTRLLHPEYNTAEFRTLSYVYEMSIEVIPR